MIFQACSGSMNRMWIYPDLEYHMRVMSGLGGGLRSLSAFLVLSYRSDFELVLSQKLHVLAQHNTKHYHKGDSSITGIDYATNYGKY